MFMLVFLKTFRIQYSSAVINRHVALAIMPFICTLLCGRPVLLAFDETYVQGLSINNISNHSLSAKYVYLYDLV